MGVLTHLDGFKDAEKLKKTKKALKHRFWTEIYQGALRLATESCEHQGRVGCLGRGHVWKRFPMSGHGT